MNIILAIGAGGAVGAIIRYLVSRWTVTVWGSGFPWGTLLVNAAGAFLIGFLSVLMTTRLEFGAAPRAMILTGLLGALTTFSTFSFETLQLLNSGEVGRGLLNIAANLSFSLLLVWLGAWIGQRL